MKLLQACDLRHIKSTYFPESITLWYFISIIISIIWKICKHIQVLPTDVPSHPFVRVRARSGANWKRRMIISEIVKYFTYQSKRIALWGLIGIIICIIWKILKVVEISPSIWIACVSSPYCFVGICTKCCAYWKATYSILIFI